MVCMNSRQKGDRYELIATRYLCRRGYKILTRQYRCPYGEIDLVAMDGKVIVFVEVKGRQSTRYGLAQEAVDRRKQRRIWRSAQHFLWSQGKSQYLCRFDVIAIQEPILGQHEIQHIVGAFDGWD
ncbi:MAG: YraN family protein [Firmicutes bacterium]|nr:YraN family protein [Bacillota bacterium]